MDIQKVIEKLQQEEVAQIDGQDLIDAHVEAISLLKELQEYRSIGTVEECRAYGEVKTRIIDAVITERGRQDKKWGVQNHFPERWATIIGEEYGEMCEAINEFSFNATYENEQQIYVEAIQTMASCMAMLECIERSRAAANNPEQIE